MSKGIKNLSKREIVLIIILMIGLLVLTGWKFSGISFYARMSDLLEQRALIKGQISIINSILAEKNDIEAEWAKWQSEQIRLNQAVPDLADINDVLGKLDAHLNRFPGTIHSFNVNEINDMDQYSEICLTLSVSDRADEVNKLLYRLENFPSLLIIDNIDCFILEGEMIKLDLDIRLIFYNNLTAEDAMEQ